MKMARFTALAGLAAVAFAGSAFAGPSMQAKDVKLMSAQPEQRSPLAVRGVRLVDGKIVGTTPWRPYQANKDAPPSAFAFDAFETGSATPAALGPNGNRYILNWGTPGTVNYVSPVRLSDMTMAPGFNGAQSTWFDHLWYAGDTDNPGTNVDFFIAVFTAEDKFSDQCAFDGVTYDGVQLQYGPGDGFFYDNVDVSSDPTLFWQLPNDGEGSYIQIFSQDDAGTIVAAGQTGLWCTGEDTLPTPEARAGTNESQEGTDESTPPQCGAADKATNIPNGIIELECECFDFTFNIPNVASVLTSSVTFGAEPGNACYPDCDGSTVLDIDDFICFQTFYAIGDPYADCDGSTVLDIDDFICFQTFYAVGCG